MVYDFVGQSNKLFFEQIIISISPYIFEYNVYVYLVYAERVQVQNAFFDVRNIG